LFVHIQVLYRFTQQLGHLNVRKGELRGKIEVVLDVTTVGW